MNIVLYPERHFLPHEWIVLELQLCWSSWMHRKWVCSPIREFKWDSRVVIGVDNANMCIWGHSSNLIARAWGATQLNEEEAAVKSIVCMYFGGSVFVSSCHAIMYSLSIRSPVAGLLPPPPSILSVTWCKDTHVHYCKCNGNGSVHIQGFIQDFELGGGETGW